MANPSSYHNAIAPSMQPGARLVLTYDQSSVVGRRFTILPGGRCLSEKLAASLTPA
jgi:hypothetical protein